MRTFWLIWSGQAVSLAGSQAAQFALVWWLAVETGAAAVLSVATLLALLPAIVGGPLIGVLVDRWPRRLTMMAADGAVALGSLVLAGLFLAGRAETATVLVFLLWRALGGAFHAPAMISATSLMVPAGHLGRIQGVNQMLQGGLGIVTAPLGAMLLGLVGIAGVMVIDVVTALCAVLPLLFVTVPEPDRKEASATGAAAFFGEVRAGFRYLRGLPGHMALIGYASVINLFLVPAFALLPLLVLEELKGDVGLQAWTISAAGVGAIAGGLALGVWGGSGRQVRTAMTAIVGLGAATFALGAAPASRLPVAVGAMLAIGAFSAVANGCIAAVMQATIAPGYQGRVFTLLMSLAAAMTPIGLILATPLTDALGVRSWYLAGGLVCAAMGAAAFLVRAIVRIESRGADAAPGTNQSSSGGDRTGRGSGTSAGSPTCPRIRVMTAPPLRAEPPVHERLNRGQHLFGVERRQKTAATASVNTPGND
jgi:DHA3 family macrolide efflux protein-like MFS transporter